MSPEPLAIASESVYLPRAGAHDHEPPGFGTNTNRSDFEMDNLRAEDDVQDDEETGLTEPERRKERQRKQKNTQLDERIASDMSASKTEERLTRMAVLKNMAINAVLIGLWYTFSIAISVYNKWMFSADNLDFHFPLFITSIHMLVQFSLASLILYLLPQFRPKRPEVDTASANGGVYTRIQDETEDAEATANVKPGPLMTPWFYLSRIAPCGTATALDIGLGNFSMRFISLTFYTMCKSSVLAFVLIFAFLFRLEKLTIKLCSVIFVMTVGVVLMVTGEAEFNALGFFLVMSASFCSGFRWSLTQILLLRNPATSNPFSSLLFLTPIMFLALFLLALPIEGPVQALAGFRALCEARGTFNSILLLLFPGTLAFMMVSAEFALIKRTSVVTLSVCGIFKEVLTISAAGITFGDSLSPVNISGLVVTIVAIAAYNWIKYDKMTREARDEIHKKLHGDAVDEQVDDELPRPSMEDEGAASSSAHPLIRDSMSTIRSRSLTGEDTIALPDGKKISGDVR
jgi:solute carrier family 35 protein C2